jgi:hypothetical protein
MRNTPLPLTIAFIEDDGTIVQLDDTGPQGRGEPLPPAGDPLCAGNGTGLVQKRRSALDPKSGLLTAR